MAPTTRSAKTRPATTAAKAPKTTKANKIAKPSTSSKNKQDKIPTTPDTNTSPLFFYQTKGKYGPLSQWYASTFTAPYTHFAPLWPSSPSTAETVLRDRLGADSFTFTHAEQYMMFSKALLFLDLDIAAQALAARSPGAQKALGRMVKGFDGAVWDQFREGVVLRGNVLKFAQDEGLRELLVETGDRELVEASPTDRIWGIGFTRDKAPGSNREMWGLNLLGKALVGARERLRDLEAVEAVEAE
jgi:ribA/ribD-fused uncharacterized protein